MLFLTAWSTQNVHFSDKCLHEQALEDGLSNHLLGLLRSTLGRMEHSTGHSRQGAGLLEPCLQCLLALLSSKESTRAALRDSQQFLTSVLRGEGSGASQWDTL